MTSFAGGSLAVSGITVAGRQMSVAFCAMVVIAYNTMAATDSGHVHFEPVCFRFAMFHPPVRSPRAKRDLLRLSGVSTKGERKSLNA